MNKELYRKLLSRYPNHIVAKMMGVSRERTRQIRQELEDMKSSRECITHVCDIEGEYHYLKIIELDKNVSKGEGIHIARDFAKRHDLPWPPLELVRKRYRLANSRGKKIYEFAKDNPEKTWAEISIFFNAKNPVARASRYAKTTGSAWPLRGGDQ